MPETPLRIHFLNVGHGDCTVVEFPSGRLTVVDINNSHRFDSDSEKELQDTIRQNFGGYGNAMLTERAMISYLKRFSDLLEDPIQFLDTRYAGREIFRFIATHPDMDHLSGLAELRDRHHTLPVLNFWDTNHNKELKREDFENGGKYRYEDWEAYQYFRGSESENTTTLRLLRGANSHYYGDEHDAIEIWAPTQPLVDHANDKGEHNHLSYVLTVRHGSTRVVLGGDATETTWKNILECFGGALPKVSILKASHHGRDSGYHYESVSAMNPDHVVVSVGKKPSTDASNKYRNLANKGVYSTRYNGTITAECYLDGSVMIRNAKGELLT